MTTKELTQKLYALEKQLAAYNHAMGLLYYDGVTSAPAGTAANRGETLNVLGEASYRMTTCEETRSLIEALGERSEELDEKTKRIVYLFSRNMEEMRKIPMDEYLAYDQLINESEAVWHEAKAENDYAKFAPYIDRMVRTLTKFAGYVRPEMNVYDYLLDKYEPKLTMADVDKFFGALRESLIPIIRRVTAAEPADETALTVDFPIEKQKALSDELMRLLCLDRRQVGIGETEHPFTTSFTRNDVRITTHYHEKLFSSSMFSVIHEGGHALYEANTDPDFAYTSLGTGVSMAVHESQSRFYENMLGRSRAFVKLIAPTLRALNPALQAFDDENLYRAFNAAKPSLIRTEADELTYCLHIMVRYELEKRLFAGEITAKDLPGEWNRLYEEYLGVQVPSDREGVLQDSHWSGGSFGYFPSYALGSAYAAQLWAKMKEEFDPEEEIAKGDLTKINEWLRSRIWTYGCLYEPRALMEKAFGAPFDAKYYVEYLKNKYEALYPEK